LADTVKVLRRQLDLAKAELIAEHGNLQKYGAGAQQSVSDVLGEGYGGVKSTTLQRHRRLLLSSIKDIVGDDVLKQAQLAASLVRHFSAQSVGGDTNQVIVDGLALTLESLRSAAGKGRSPTDVKIAQQSIVSAAVAACKLEPDRMQLSDTLLAKILHVSRNSVKSGKARVSKFLHGGTSLPYNSTEKSNASKAYPEAYTEFVQKCWQSMTRASENKKDEVRNPEDHSDKQRRRIRWVEVPLHVLRGDMIRKGEAMFGDEFHLSSTKMRDLKPFYIRRPGRQTCLCRYHLGFDHFFKALRRWSLQEDVKACK
jgi:hypothetical protein